MPEGELDGIKKITNNIKKIEITEIPKKETLSKITDK